jgi:hypothetical protein
MLRRGRAGLAIEGAGEIEDAGGDDLVLGRVGGQEIEGLTPGGERGAYVASVRGALRFGGQVLELVGMHEALAGRAGEQRRCDVRATLRADGGRLSRDPGAHRDGRQPDGARAATG